MSTLIPVETVIPSPFAAATTTFTVAPAFSKDPDQLSLTTALGTTTTSATMVGLPTDYSNYYQTASYVESLSDEELAKLTNEIDEIIIDNNKAKVYIKTPDEKI